MKTIRIFSILASLFFLSSFVLIASQDAQDENVQNRQRIRENIMTLRLLRMTQALDLTEEQTAMIFPTINRLEKEKLEIQRQMSREIRDLRLLLREKPAQEEEIAKKYKSVKDLRLLTREKDDALEKYLEENLTPIQEAKYLLFTIEFNRSLEEQLNRVRIRRSMPLPKK